MIAHLLGFCNCASADGNRLIRHHRCSLSGEVFVYGDEISFVVGQSLVPDFLAVLGDGASPMVCFPTPRPRKISTSAVIITGAALNYLEFKTDQSSVAKFYIHVMTSIRVSEPRP